MALPHLGQTPAASKPGGRKNPIRSEMLKAMASASAPTSKLGMPKGPKGC